jgi:hypothetical protein
MLVQLYKKDMQYYYFLELVLMKAAKADCLTTAWPKGLALFSTR